MDTRYESEKVFHDLSPRDDGKKSLNRFYSITSASVDAYTKLLLERCRGRTVLEYGCGTGSSAFLLARSGATVTGIDISGARIEIARREAQEQGLDNVTFRVMNAEHLEFDDDMFDVICGKAIIHHLDLAQAFTEIVRTLRPGGSAIFAEPLGHNPLINLYRRHTPQYRTPDEHPLVQDDFRLIRRYFDRVEVQHFHFTSLAAVPLAGSALQQRLIDKLDWLDRQIFHAAPPMRRYAWMAVMVLESPRKSTRSAQAVPSP